MRLHDGRHLGYCTNVHAYGDLAGLLAALEQQSAPLAVRLREAGLLGDERALGVGLWLPARVAHALASDPAPLRRHLQTLGLYAFTVNAFPYGEFHGARVKDDVFRPTWAETARLDYTLAAAEVLAALLPAGEHGSISTHSGGFKGWGADAPSHEAVARGLLAAAEGLADLEQRTGRRVVLAVEPEPLSTLETTGEVEAFFAERLLPAGEAARRHLGLCFDACHQAVEFERVADSLAALHEARVPIAKVQLSSAIRVEQPARALDLLAPWAEDRWFHQVVVRQGDGSLRRLSDLAEALADERAPEEGPWRVHFHVPIFAERLDEEGRLGTTRADLQDLLDGCDDVAHLEIETYSYSMIPSDRRRALGLATLQECLLREFGWALERV
jgi:sugar phosphate isomerase/epimerase